MVVRFVGYEGLVRLEVCPPGSPENAPACAATSMTLPGSFGIFVDDASDAIELHVVRGTAPATSCAAVTIDVSGAALDFHAAVDGEAGAIDLTECGGRCGPPASCLP